MATTAPLSGWWRRAAALLLDGVVLTLVLLAATFAFGFWAGLLGLDVGFDSDAFTIGYLLASLVLNCLYAPILMTRRGAENGQTLGKQALGIRVVRVDGAPVTFATGVRRTVLGQQLPSLVTLSVYSLFDFLWPLADKRNRALHDKIAKTLVVQAGKAEAPAGLPVAPSLSGWETPAGPPAWERPARGGWLPPRAGG